MDSSRSGVTRHGSLAARGGFGSIVLDMGAVTPEYSSRVPLTSWFRYRAAAERSQSSILLLTQQPCAGSSAGLVLSLSSAGYSLEQLRVFTGLRFHIEVERQRFAPVSNVMPLVDEVSCHA